MRLHVPELVDQLIHDHLNSGNRVLRERAAEFLSKTRSRAVTLKLAEALNSPREYVATRAAWGLTFRGDSRSVGLLEKTLLKADGGVRERAAWALGRIENPRARRALVAALNSPRRGVRADAAAALWRAAVNGYRSARVEKTLIGLLKGDRGHVALTLSHMLRNRTCRPPKRPAGRLTAFELYGGSWIR